MTNDNLVYRLHDKATRGEHLTDEEQVYLETWYAEQDKIENKDLSKPIKENTIAKLQLQIETTLTQLTVITNRIQKISIENESLREEIIKLRHQLSHSFISQQAA